MIKILSKRAQSLVEYSILTIVIISALIAMSVMIKRSVQGRMQSATQDFGDPYDPTTANGVTKYVLNSSSHSLVSVVEDGGVLTTQRTDATSSQEDVTSNVTVE